MDSEVVIVGAGPYGLAVATHLQDRRVERRVFGEPMESWSRNMPRGMLLRSSPGCSQIADPRRRLTLDHYRRDHGVPFRKPLPVEDFVGYGEWYQRSGVPDLDRRRVACVRQENGGFRVRLEDGDELSARHIVVAAGISPFAWRPPEFHGLPADMASHTNDHGDFAPFRGRRVAVVGAGQSALESAALLHEAGADVEVLIRKPSIFWLSARKQGGGTVGAAVRGVKQVLRPLVRPNFDIMGPRLVSWLIAAPRVFRRSPAALQQHLIAAAVRPAGAGWLVPRLAGVRLTTGRRVGTATPIGTELRLTLDDGSERRVDHVLLATGYRMDVRHYPFLSYELRQKLEITDGYPALGPGFESSVPGLHFVGAAGMRSFGPLCRFVVGSGYAARAVTWHIYDRVN